MGVRRETGIQARVLNEMIEMFVKTEVVKENNDWYSLWVKDTSGEERIYRELTRDLPAIKHLSERINRGDVSSLHINDIIEDFLP